MEIIHSAFTLKTESYGGKNIVYVQGEPGDLLKQSKTKPPSHERFNSFLSWLIGSSYDLLTLYKQIITRQ